ncbi:MAG: DNA-binding GntR family transcriptional regulator [Gammaproteobacteria bacterium]|jgi:DNA-binding GntR family transcriptional regulator
MAPTAPAKQDFPSLGEYAYERLRARIREGALPPGTRVREAEVAGQLGISRTPVREALRRLEADGFLTFEPHRGTVVVQLDHQSVMELYAMREALEGTAAGLAAQHASEAEIANLCDMLDREAAILDDPQGLATHNAQFHQMLFRAAHNRYLLKTANALRDSMALMRGTTMAVPGRAGTAHDEHRALVEAIRTRQSGAAERAARGHIHSAQTARLKLLFNAV